MRWLLLLVAVMVLGLAGPLSAALLDRGGGLIYDTDQNITWIQNASLGAATNWVSAMSWADSLVYGGYDDWRLPTTPGTVNSAYTDEGEMGHLRYELGNIPGGPLSYTAPFISIARFYYWTGTSYSANPDWAWAFNFFDGMQSHGDKLNGLYVWAVRPGDVSAPVPEPATMLLLGSGLIGLAGLWRKFKK